MRRSATARRLASIWPDVRTHMMDAGIAVVEDNEGGAFAVREITRDALGFGGAFVFRERLTIVLVADDPAPLRTRFNVDG